MQSSGKSQTTLFGKSLAILVQQEWQWTCMQADLHHCFPIITAIAIWEVESSIAHTFASHWQLPNTRISINVMAGREKISMKECDMNQ